MLSISRVFISVLLCAVVVVALPRWHQGRYVGFEADDRRDLMINAHFFDQRLDHFDRSINDTFKQRYFVNETYWKGAESNAPVFICIGGEGTPIDWRILVSSVHCNDMVELAPSVGALMVALEHRYYGPSTPKNDLSTENLRWLNTEQALGDIAYFQSLIAKQFSLTSQNKWVTWGGSYPGMLAALSRLRFPHLFHASVSSSSPLWAQVEMEEYNEVVADAIATASVGGSQACLSAVVDGHASIKGLLGTEDGRRQLEKTFNLCVPNSLDDVKNQEQFAGDGVIYIPAQSNDPSCTTPYCDIASVCSLMVDESVGTPMDRLAKLSSIQHAGTCVTASYETMLKGISNPSNPIRSWLYQTCTEWGFYQTCPEGSKCPYVQGLHTLEVDYDICQTAFSVSAETVNAQVEYANTVYGGKDIQGWRIMYPNGEIDPWHALGVLSSPNNGQPVLWVEGASHHFWTHPSLPTDSKEVVQAREAIWEQVTEWLKE